MHIDSQPSILYFGTPVVLISTKNQNHTDNLAPMSSIFWLGWRCIIGLAAASKTTQNLIHTGECVLNLPSVHQAGAVDFLAKTTGSNPVPPGKVQKGYRYHEDKFSLAGLNKQASETVQAPRVQECPVQMEAVVEAVHGLADGDAEMRGKILTFELLIKRVYLDESILLDGHPNRVDPNKWKPLIMSFQQFYGLGEQVHSSTLAQIPEHLYNTPDREKAINRAALTPML
ncbi:flavin reductase family protein [Mucilaginibacter sp. ZT4R22]|uniref:Flavin reductase family protein n=1 Tax=Mucilaginibacter pankratovii TaxID=2772110 RepID=A0ABR7WQ21_9SPHI|nr:flavin reductase family protein [Mucilaginibacter pankratovii]MBD1363577.1 flavin reductase family protein [Mucilaginibacter pankratovii]